MLASGTGLAHNSYPFVLQEHPGRTVNSGGPEPVQSLTVGEEGTLGVNQGRGGWRLTAITLWVNPQLSPALLSPQWGQIGPKFRWKAALEGALRSKMHNNSHQHLKTLTSQRRKLSLRKGRGLFTQRCTARQARLLLASICYGVVFTPLDSYFEVLNSSISECQCTWRWCL